MKFYRIVIVDEMFKEWEQTPEEGQRVEVEYPSKDTNNNVWWRNGKFVNKYGFELYNIIGWKPYKKTTIDKGNPYEGLR